MKDDTRLVHAGKDPEHHYGIVNMPVYRASTVLSPTLSAFKARADGDRKYRGVRYGAYGTPTTYVNRSSQGGSVRMPDFTGTVPGTENDVVVAGTLTLTYESGGQVYTLTDNGAGLLTGAGTGVIDYASRMYLCQPSHMPDPQGQFLIDCQMDALVTEVFPSPALVGGNYVLSLANIPAARSVRVQWGVLRNVITSSGAAPTPMEVLKPAESSSAPAGSMTAMLGIDWELQNALSRAMANPPTVPYVYARQA